MRNANVQVATVSSPLGSAHRLTRRSLVTGGLVTGAILASGLGPRPAHAQTPRPETRVIDTIHGPVAVPIHPQRIVAIDPYASLQVLDELGAPLVAAGSPGTGPRLLVSSESQDLPSVSASGEVDLEAVVIANPDLIVGTSGIADVIYDQLTGIAPTIVTDVVNSGWREIALLTADAANLKPDMEAKFDGLAERIADLDTQLAGSWPNGLSVSVVRLMPDQIVRSYGSWRTSFVAADMLNSLESVSVTADEFTSEDDPNHVLGFAELSYERLQDIDADVILYYVGGFGTPDDSAPDQIAQTFLEHPLYSSLQAAAAGHVYEVDSAHWFWGRNVLAAQLILDDLEHYLLEAAG